MKKLFLFICLTSLMSGGPLFNLFKEGVEHAHYNFKRELKYFEDYNIIGAGFFGYFEMVYWKPCGYWGNYVSRGLDMPLSHDLKRKIQPYFGIYHSNISEEVMIEKKLSSQEGVLIDSIILDTPAEKANLKSGDILVEMEGQKIGNTDSLKAIIKEMPVNKKITVKVIRNDVPIELGVNLYPAIPVAKIAGEMAALLYVYNRVVEEAKERKKNMSEYELVMNVGSIAGMYLEKLSNMLTDNFNNTCNELWTKKEHGPDGNISWKNFVVKTAQELK